MRPAEVIIDPNACLHNFNIIRKHAPQSKILAVAKANAYGHRISLLKDVLNQADGIAVCSLDEALDYATQGITTSMVLMEGFFNPAELPIIAELGYYCVIHCKQQLQQFLHSNYLHIPIWLKVDTGMHRLGFMIEELPEIISLLNQQKIRINFQLMTHFACADEKNHPLNKNQIEKINLLKNNYKNFLTCVNSAGIWHYPEVHAEWIRPGIALYGISPFADRTGQDLGLKPVMTVTSAIIATKNIAAGETVGYGAVWQAQRNSRIGIIAFGYADGYPRHAANGTPVWIDHHIVPLVGRVSMDMLAVDLTDFPDIDHGAKVILWGGPLSIEYVAQNAQTIPYELVCKITNRVPFNKSI